MYLGPTNCQQLHWTGRLLLRGYCNDYDATIVHVICAYAHTNKHAISHFARARLIKTTNTYCVRKVIVCCIPAVFYLCTVAAMFFYMFDILQLLVFTRDKLVNLPADKFISIFKEFDIWKTAVSLKCLLGSLLKYVCLCMAM